MSDRINKQDQADRVISNLPPEVVEAIAVWIEEEFINIDYYFNGEDPVGQTESGDKVIARLAEKARAMKGGAK